MKKVYRVYSEAVFGSCALCDRVKNIAEKKKKAISIFTDRQTYDITACLI